MNSSNQETKASDEKVEAITTKTKDTVPSSSSSSESESGWVNTVPIDSDKQKSLGQETQNSLESSSSKIQAEEHEDDSYDQSNASLILDIEGLCSTNNVTFSWDFNNKKIKVTKNYKNIIK